MAWTTLSRVNGSSRILRAVMNHLAWLELCSARKYQNTQSLFSGIQHSLSGSVRAAMWPQKFWATCWQALWLRNSLTLWTLCFLPT
ncbi:hypothetical protein DFH09DRAFT_1142657 [Mycena vulgaris]|nr:hypothetical protein DFH09DRAFT_1142657 [Mycena vulgaris]